MQRFTIIKRDQFVSVDGKGKTPVDFLLPDEVHAVQWYGQYGEIEFEPIFDGQTIIKPENQIISDFEQFQPVLDAWAAIPDPVEIPQEE